MKKNSFFLLCIVGTTICFGQRFYVGAKLGYGTGMPGERYNKTYTYQFEDYASNNTPSSTNYTSESKPGGYGAGITTSLLAGYMFNKIVGAELGLGYFYGNVVTSSDINSIFNYATNDALSFKYTSKNEIKRRFTSIYLNPTLVLHMPSESKFKPYTRIGFIIGLANQYEGKSIFNASSSFIPDNFNDNHSTILTGRDNTEGKISFGFNASVGTDYMITNTISVFGELSIMTNSIDAKSNTIERSGTRNNASGNVYSYFDKSSTEYVNYYPTSSKYVDAITPITGPDINFGSKTVRTFEDGRVNTTTYIVYTNGNQDTTSESTGNKATTGAMGMISSIGLNVGVRYYFGK